MSVHSMNSMNAVNSVNAAARGVVLARPLPSVRVQSLATALAVAAAVALPQAFHLAGAALGVGAGLGQALLPMHLPVLLVGLLAGPFAGAATGAFAPLLSFALTGMPVVAMVPFMVLELAAYGLFAGLLRGSRLCASVPVPASDADASGVRGGSITPWRWLAALLAAQVAGRVVRAVAVLVAVGVFGNAQVAVSSIWTSVADGLPGLVLQWVLVPAVLALVERASRHV